MLKFSSPIFALVAILLLASCQGGAPKPVPEPQQPTASTTSQPAGEAAATSADTEQPEPAPVDYHQQRYDRALAELKNGDAEEALLLLTRVREHAPDKPHLFTNIGLAHFQLQQTGPAEQAFIQAIARNPDDAVAHNHLGILQRHSGHFEEALIHYQRAIEIDSNYAGAYLNLGILFDLYLQDLEKALQQYRQYQSLVSEDNALVDGWIVDIERRLKAADT